MTQRQRLYLAHTSTHWACIVAASHAEARALCKADDAVLQSLGDAVGQDVTGSFGQPRVVRAFRRREVKKGTVKL